MKHSVVYYEAVMEDNDLFRIDAEFFHPDYLKFENNIKSKNWNYLENIAKQIINFGAYSLTNQIEYLDEGVPFLNVGNIKDNEINLESVKKIDKELSINVLKKSLCKENQILLTIAGTIGNAAVVHELPRHTNSNQAIANITLESVSPFYLSVYLNSFYGKQQTTRLIISSVQPNLLLTQVKKIKVFIPHIDFQNFIENLYKQAHQIKKQSASFYTEAQSILLSEIGLANSQPKHRLAFTKHYSDIKKSERMDAEYFQPKYDKIVNAVKSYSGGWDTLGNLCDVVGHPSNPPYSENDENKKIFIVSQKHLGEYSLTDSFWKNDDAKHTTKEFIEENEDYILRNDDLVLYTVGGPPHIGKANLIFETNVKATIGSFVTLVRANKTKINPHTLLVLFNSVVGRQLTNKFQRGMVQQYIYPKDLIQTVVPIPPKKIQTKIQQKITESFALRKRSKHLLECAKRAVEIAIEEDEKTARAWLRKATKE